MIVTQKCIRSTIKCLFTVTFFLTVGLTTSEAAHTPQKIPDTIHSIQDIPTWVDGVKWCFEKYNNAKKSGNERETKRYANYILDILRNGTFIHEGKPITYGVHNLKGATDAEFGTMMIALTAPAWELASDSIHGKSVDITKQTTPVLWRVKELLSLGKKKEATHFLVVQILYWVLADVFIDNQKPGPPLFGHQLFDKLMERLDVYRESTPEIRAPSKQKILQIFNRWWSKTDGHIKGIPSAQALMISFENQFGKLASIEAPANTIADTSHNVEDLSTWQNALTWCIEKYDDAKESDNETEAKKYAKYILDIIERGAFKPKTDLLRYDIHITNATDEEFSLMIKALSIPSWELASDFIQGKTSNLMSEVLPIKRQVLNLAAADKNKATHILVARGLYWLLTDVFITNQKKGSSSVYIHFFNALMRHIQLYETQHPHIAFPTKNEILHSVMQWWEKMKTREQGIPSAYDLMTDLQLDYGRLFPK